MPFQLTINLIRAVLTILTRRLPPRPFIVCAAMRMFFYVFTPRQMQLMVPSTTATYKSFIRRARRRARKQGDVHLMESLREDIEVLPDGASRILWIGNRHRATKFVYFLHGGGYIVPATSGHFESALQSYMVGADERVAVAFLQYTLAPAARFPVQMRQAVAGLRHLLAAGIRPGQIVVGGDSAGGNLAVQVLTHALRAYDAAGAALALDEPLAGAFLVSPLVTGDFGGRSFRDGRPCDMISRGALAASDREMHRDRRFGGVVGWLLPGWALVESREFREGKRWALMARVDDKWLGGMGRVVRRVYVTVGKHEILRDQGITLAEILRRENKDVDVKLEVAEKEAHDFILVEGLGMDVGDATVRMRTWFSQVWA